MVTATTLQRVLQALLRERVSIRDLPAILEGIGEAAPHTASRHPAWSSRSAPAWPASCAGSTRATTAPCRSSPCRREWEQAFADALVGQGEEKQLAMAPSRLQDFIRGVRDAFERAAMAGETRGAADQPQIRPYVRSIIERFRGQTVVMSQNEVHPKARLKTIGQV